MADRIASSLVLKLLFLFAALLIAAVQLSSWLLPEPAVRGAAIADDTVDPLSRVDDYTAYVETSEGVIAAKSVSRLMAKLPAKRDHWITHAQAPIDHPGPRLAVIIDDVGISPIAVDELAEMPPLTLALLPYARDVRASAVLLRAAGHELMVHLPMQPKIYGVDPGPNALLDDLPPQELNRRIAWNLSQFERYIGVNNHMGSFLTEQPVAMARVMAALRRRGLIYVDSLTSAKSMGKRAAAAVGVPFLARDIFLDNNRDPEAIAAQLARAEDVANRQGYAIAIGHPYPETLEVLRGWRRAAEERGLVLVPLSQLMLEFGQNRRAG